MLQQAQNLHARIDEYVRLAKAHKDASATRTRSDEVKELRDRISQTVARMRVMRDEGGVAFVVPDATSARETIAEYRAQLKVSDDEVGKVHNKLKRLTKKLHDDLEKTVDAAIGALEKSIPSIDETYLKEVEQIPGYATKVQEVRRERAALLSGRALSDMDATQLSVFLKRRTFVSSLAANLTPTEFPKEVREFFAAMKRGGGAPLDKFTEVVQEWLKERDQLKNVRITLVTR